MLCARARRASEQYDRNKCRSNSNTIIVILPLTPNKRLCAFSTSSSSSHSLLFSFLRAIYFCSLSLSMCSHRRRLDEALLLLLLPVNNFLRSRHIRFSSLLTACLRSVCMRLTCVCLCTEMFMSFTMLSSHNSCVGIVTIALRSHTRHTSYL